MFLDESAFDVDDGIGVPRLTSSATPKNQAAPEIKSGRYNNSTDFSRPSTGGGINRNVELMNIDDDGDLSSPLGSAGAIGSSSSSRARMLAQQREIQLKKRQSAMQSGGMVRSSVDNDEDVRGSNSSSQFTPAIRQFSAPKSVKETFAEDPVVEEQFSPKRGSVGRSNSRRLPEDDDDIVEKTFSKASRQGASPPGREKVPPRGGRGSTGYDRDEDYGRGGRGVSEEDDNYGRGGSRWDDEAQRGGGGRRQADRGGRGVRRDEDERGYRRGDPYDDEEDYGRSAPRGGRGGGEGGGWEDSRGNRSFREERDNPKGRSFNRRDDDYGYADTRKNRDYDDRDRRAPRDSRGGGRGSGPRRNGDYDFDGEDDDIEYDDRRGGGRAADRRGDRDYDPRDGRGGRDDKGGAKWQERNPPSSDGPIPRGLGGDLDVPRAFAPPDLSDMRRFLVSPIPKSCGVIQCYIRRNKSGTNKLFPLYSLYMKEGDRFLMCSKKRPKNKTSNYLISKAEGDISKGGEHYLGKLRSNFVGTEFQFFDDGASPHDTDGGERADHTRVELGSVMYAPNVLGSRGPRKMQVVIPCVDENNQMIRPKNPGGVPFQEGDFLQRMKDHSFRDLVYMINKPPRWNEQVQAYVLNFNGRVTMASVKNFQLVDPEEQNTVLLQFGRVGKDDFTMDMQWPFSPLQAFAVTLSSFDSKIACD